MIIRQEWMISITSTSFKWAINRTATCLVKKDIATLDGEMIIGGKH